MVCFSLHMPMNYPGDLRQVIYSAEVDWDMPIFPGKGEVVDHKLFIKALEPNSADYATNLDLNEHVKKTIWVVDKVTWTKKTKRITLDVYLVDDYYHKPVSNLDLPLYWETISKLIKEILGEVTLSTTQIVFFTCSFKSRFVA